MAKNKEKKLKSTSEIEETKVVKRSKKEKRKHFMEEKIEIDSIKSDKSQDSVTKKKKRKKKKEENDVEETNDNVELQDNIVNSTAKQKEKKKKKRKAVDDGVVSDSHKKLKVNDDSVEKDTTNDILVSVITKCEFEKEEKKKRKSNKKRKHKLKAETNDVENIDAVEQSIEDLDNQKKKKKSTKNEESAEMEDIVVEHNENSADSKSKKKKKKKSELNNSDIKEKKEESHAAFENQEAAKKKKKKKKSKDISDSPENTKEEKVTVSTINSDRLDNEINNEIQAENGMNGKPENQSSLVQGQWKGNLFESEDRQNKFLRLLGGMKKTTDSPKGKGLFGSLAKGPKGKGLFGSLGSLTATGTTSNVAMSQDAAVSLNKALEDDYNRALNLKLGKGRGKGLGFTPDPAEGKKFHIDTQNVKSKKFDD